MLLMLKSLYKLKGVISMKFNYFNTFSLSIVINFVLDLNGSYHIDFLEVESWR